MSPPRRKISKNSFGEAAVIFGVLAALIVINVMSYFGYRLYLSILAGIILVGLINGFSAGQFLSLSYASLTGTATVNLVLIVISLTAFGNLLKETGQLKSMMDKMSLVLIDRRLQVAVLSAVVGLLAFPGGAVFSAPMVEEAGLELGVGKLQLAVSNVMFRHVLYLIYPFYPGLIMAAELTKISVFYFIRTNLILFAVFSLFLFLNLFRGIRPGGGSKTNMKELPALLWSLFPLLVIIVPAIALKMYFPLAVLLGVAFLLFYNLPPQTPFGSIKERLTWLLRGVNWPMVISIALVLVLKDFLEQSGAVQDMAAFMLARGVPLLALVVVIPLVTGAITGSNTAALGIAVPLLLAAAPQGGIAPGLLALAYVSSLAGYLGSPIHLCTVLTAEHFGVSLLQSVKRINFLGLCMILPAVALFLITRALGF